MAARTTFITVALLLSGAAAMLIADRKDMSSVRGVCADGDVMAGDRNGSAVVPEDGVPFHPWIWYQGGLHPICGHFFWHTSLGPGAENVCKRLGFASGTGDDEREAYPVDALLIGYCDATQSLVSCDLSGYCGNSPCFVVPTLPNYCTAGASVSILLTCTGGSPTSPASCDVPTAAPTLHPTPPPTAAPTAAPFSASSTGGATTSAKGDPHLENVLGQRFDLMQPGRHVLVQIPRLAPAQRTLLSVVASAFRLGPQCGDVYFQDINITGAWLEAKHDRGTLQFRAADGADEMGSTWMTFGTVDLKVVHGRTLRGVRYLNFYAKHLAGTGFVVGGLLGEDDHEGAATPDKNCLPSIDLRVTS